MTRLAVLGYLAALFLVASLMSSGSATESSKSSGSQTGTQPRQSTSTVLSTLGMLVPGLISSVAPLVLLFGIGAMMMPALGMSAMGLLRESRRSASDQAATAATPNMAFQNAFSQLYGGGRPLQASPQDYYYFTKRSFPSLMSNVNAAGIARGLQDMLERVLRAVDNADKRYN